MNSYDTDHEDFYMGPEPEWPTSFLLFLLALFLLAAGGLGTLIFFLCRSALSLFW